MISLLPSPPKLYFKQNTSKIYLIFLAYVNGDSIKNSTVLGSPKLWNTLSSKKLWQLSFSLYEYKYIKGVLLSVEEEGKLHRSLVLNRNKGSLAVLTECSILLQGLQNVDRKNWWKFCEEHKKVAWSCHPFNLQGNVELGLETRLQLLVGLNEKINEVSDLADGFFAPISLTVASTKE